MSLYWLKLAKITFITESSEILTFLTGIKFDYFMDKVFSYSCLRPTGHSWRNSML
ncbi:hypothetical protein AT1219_40150 [Vibrio alginolyticus]